MLNLALKSSSSIWCSSSLTHFRITIAIIFTFWVNAAFSTQPPAEALSRLNAGQSVDLIVEYDSTPIELQAAKLRQGNIKQIDSPSILAVKTGLYKTLKNSVDLAAAHPDLEQLADYSHLPMSFKRFHSLAALNALLSRPEIKGVYLNGQAHKVLAQSLPLINQPAVTAVGEQGNGTTVAVIDDGIDYTNAAFGSCTAPGVPATCHVSTSLLFGTGTTDTTHGTNVSAIVLGVAPASRIAMLNAFSGTGASFADIISAMNWAIANQSTYNIVAINMSLGDGTKNTAPCNTGNVFSTPVTNAINTGITIVAAAGNDAYTNALGSPACTPGVISVGAVYDSNLSNQGYPNGVTWGNNLCTDSSTSTDKITCFSDSASFLTMLAPGALITAAGISDGGTSQASPHVAGAVAVLRAAFPTETLAQTQTRMTGSGVMITDTRNGIIKPRLDLLAAARPANDMFINRFTLAGTSGSTSATSLLATKETGEPNHAGNSGGSSVWWKWTAPSSGQVSLDTKGSGFSTLLAVYTGKSVSALTSIASNSSATGASSLLYEALAGTEYEIAVDGVNGVSGNVILNWSLNTTAAAKLSVSLSGPADVGSGSTADYTLTISNAGPQTATNVVATINLPAGASLISSPAGCSAVAGTVTCLAGNIQNGGNISLVLQILLNSAVATESLAASITSDVPNPNPAGTTSSLQILVTNSPDSDVPTLPEWGLILLAMLLMATTIRAQKNNPNGS